MCVINNNQNDFGTDKRHKTELVMIVYAWCDYNPFKSKEIVDEKTYSESANRSNAIFSVNFRIKNIAQQNGCTVNN